MNDYLNSKYSYINKDDYQKVKGEDWPEFIDFQQHQTVPKWVYDEIDTMLLQKEPFTHPSFCVLPWHAEMVPA